MKLAKGFRIAAYAAMVLGLAVNARADFITAYGWVSTDAIAGSATGATVGSLGLATCSHGTAACTVGNADVTFTTTGIDFSATDATISTWLASSGFPLDGLVDNAASTLMSPTIWEFIGNGSFTSPDPFSITQDDGVTFVVNGQVVVNNPGPNSPTTTLGTYTGGAGGNLPFSLIYTECCQGPAVLKTDLVGPENAPIPEPASIALLGTALLGLGSLLRRKIA